MKLRIALATAALGAAGLLGLAACGSADAAASLTPEQTALTTVGFTQDDVTTVAPADDPAADPSASPGTPAPGASPASKHPRRDALRLRHALSQHVEHGEVVVQTKKGDKTVHVQRGTVTAVTATSVTVKSADGFTWTWAYGSPLHVVQDRAAVQPGAVKTGMTVGVAGAKNGSTVTANLIVLPKTGS